MSARETTLPFPMEGRDDSAPSSEQSLLSTRDCSDMRGRDHVTGRYCGAHRPGWKKACAVPIGAVGGRALASITVDTRHAGFTQLTTPTTEWTATGPTGKDTYAVREDDFGDSYALEGGTHIVIRNSVGTEQAKIVLPVGSTAQVCRALALDPTLRLVFVGVSAGGIQNRAKIWCYSDVPYQGWQVLWQVDTALFVEKLSVENGLLTAGMNDTDTGRAWVAQFSALTSSAIEDWRTQVVAPLTVLDVAPNDGDIATGSGFNTSRGLDPRQQGTGQILDRAFTDYWFDSLPNWTTRHFSIFDPAELDLANGASVLSLQDAISSNREIHPASDPVKINGFAGKLTNQPGGGNVAVGDKIVCALPDGSLTETYTFVVAAAAVGEVSIGANFGVSLANLDQVITNGGDGITSVVGTQPSILVATSNLTASSAKIACNSQRDIVEVTLTSTSNFSINGILFQRLRREKTVTPTAATFKKIGMAGRPCLYYDGVSAKMETLDNPNKLVAGADQEHSLWPGYGINQAVGASSRFASFIVLKPYPTFSKSCAVAQRVELAGGGQYVRRIVSNRNAAGDYERGKIGIVEREAGATRTHAANYLTDNTANFTLISTVSNPTGNYEQYVNGSPAYNAVPAATGVAVANDSTSRTQFGQSSFAGEDENFWQGEQHIMVVVHSLTDEPITVAERQIFEGVIAWYFGAAALLPVGHPYQLVPPPPTGLSTADWYMARQALSLTPIATKLDAKTHEVSWMAASDVDTPNTIGGLGSGLVFTSDGNIVSIGKPVVMAGPGSDTASVRQLIDKGDTFELGWSYTLGNLQSETFSYDNLEPVADASDNVFVPFFAEQYVSGPPPQFLMFDRDGVLVLAPFAEEGQAAYSIDIGRPLLDLSGTTITRPEKLVIGTRREATTTLQAANFANGDTVTFIGPSGTDQYTFLTVIALPNDVLIDATLQGTLSNLQAAVNGGPGSGTLYGALTPQAKSVVATVLTATSLTFAARQYSADTTASSSSVDLVFTNLTLLAGTGNIRVETLVTRDPVVGSGRLPIETAITGPDFTKYSLTSSQVITGGAGLFNPTARYVHAASHYGRVFVTDGSRSAVYDGRTDVAELFVARSGGTVPQGIGILEQWRSRLIAVDVEESPYAIYGSRVDDDFDWNRGPAVFDGLQAFKTQASAAGTVPESINGFAPINDDLAVVICPKSFWRVTGDPAPGSNGQIHPIPSICGGAYGRAWALGPQSSLFVFGSNGELMRMDALTSPTSVCGPKFAKTFQEIDLSLFYMRMAWNTRMDGLDIVACPYGGVDLPSQAFFWERATAAIWPDSHNQRILDLIAVRGENPKESVARFSCSDGVVRTWDEEAEDDDGTDFEGRVLIGPIALTDVRLQTQLNRLQVWLERQSAACFVEVLTSDEASGTRFLLERHIVRPGNHAELPVRASGNFLWVQIRGQQHFAFEAASCFLSAGGFKRSTVTA